MVDQKLPLNFWVGGPAGIDGGYYYTIQYFSTGSTDLWKYNPIDTLRLANLINLSIVSIISSIVIYFLNLVFFLF